MSEKGVLCLVVEPSIGLHLHPRPTIEGGTEWVLVLIEGEGLWVLVLIKGEGLIWLWVVIWRRERGERKREKRNISY